MGIRDRISSALVKAPSVPPGSVVVTESQMRAMSEAVGNQNRVQGYFQTLFGPGQPLFPNPINAANADGKPDPRRNEYLTSENINLSEGKLTPFKILRQAADQIDINRRCLEVLKAKISGLEWDITLGEDASELIAAKSGETDHVRAMIKAREQFTDEIARCKTFWENPDRSNGLTFVDWLMIALEEILVIDAWAVWPQKTVGKDLYGLQILDGSTIKPLIDDRGMRPTPPKPAYQQILYGFPRSEFFANNDATVSDGEFTSEDLAYMVHNRRTTSMYGLSPVERSLPLADLYLRRQQWLRAEYTDGVTPELMFKTDPTVGSDPKTLKAYEDIFNNELAGQAEQRKRARFLPSGLDPIVQEGYAEKFKDTFDHFLLNSICGHYGVLPSEIGFAMKGGLGHAGQQQGEAQSAQAIGVGPLSSWIARMLTNLSHAYLGMPRELEFRFMSSERMDTAEAAQKANTEIMGGQKTLNERRADLGLPLIDTPAADQPILVAGGGVFLFTPDGIVNVATPPPGAEEIDPDAPKDGPKPKEDAPKPKDKVDPEIDPVAKKDPKAVNKEVKSFLKFASKGARGRPFDFEFVDPIVGEALNDCYLHEDMDTAYSLAKAYLL